LVCAAQKKDPFVTSCTTVSSICTAHERPCFLWYSGIPGTPPPEPCFLSRPSHPASGCYRKYHEEHAAGGGELWYSTSRTLFSFPSLSSCRRRLSEVARVACSRRRGTLVLHLPNPVFFPVPLFLPAAAIGSSTTSLQPAAGNGERWSVQPPPCPPAKLRLPTSPLLSSPPSTSPASSPSQGRFCPARVPR
jgi:hypothetical protein